MVKKLPSRCVCGRDLTEDGKVKRTIIAVDGGRVVNGKFQVPTDKIATTDNVKVKHVCVGCHRRIDTQ